MKNAQWIWVLAAGLAVGFLIGREVGKGSDAGDGKSPSAAAGKVGGPAGAIPADWILEADLKATDQFAGLTPGQRYQALKALNETPCDCGCPHGSVAKCKKEDPGCPRGPVWIEKAVALAKEGKTADQIAAAVKQAKPAAAAPEAPSGPQKAEIAAWSPIRGPKFAKVTLVMWSDFQCPFCSRVEPTIKQVEDTYGKDVRVIWRNQPLPFHPNAKPAAEAAMAANAQGKFWEMHDKIFANQAQLDRATYEKYAQELGLNMAKFKADLDGEKYKDQIEADSAAGTKIGASGTPASFINGRSVSGAQPFDAFKSVVDAEIKHADELLKKGVTMDKLYEKILADAASAPAPAAAAAPPAEHQDVQVGSAPVKGAKNAPVTMVIFSDFQCPFCSRVEPTFNELEKTYAGKLKMAWKNQPLPFHNHAQLDAEAAMAAGEQGKFWEYHDKLFANQNAQERPDLEKYAQELGLDMAKFKAALDSGKFKAQIKADSEEGTKLGASGTPTMFINGWKIVGAQPVDAFKKLIDQELAKKK